MNVLSRFAVFCVYFLIVHVDASGLRLVVPACGSCLTHQSTGCEICWLLVCLSVRWTVSRGYVYVYPFEGASRHLQSDLDLSVLC